LIAFSAGNHDYVIPVARSCFAARSAIQCLACTSTTMPYWHWSALSWSVRLTTYSPIHLENFWPGFSQFWMPLLDWSFRRRNRITISPLLHELQWLRVPDRIRFRLCVLV